MQAEFQLIADGKDITALMRDRLLQLTLTDKTGMASDSCEVRLDDRDGKIAIPRKGAKLDVGLGWQGKGTALLGSYEVDEVSLECPPATMTIRARAADMRKQAKSSRTASYENTTLEALVGTIAARHGWTPACQVKADISRADQFNESDLHFITRIAHAYNATATIKAGKLLVLLRGSGKTASGQPSSSVELSPGDVSHYSFTFADRSAYAKVQVRAYDTTTGKQLTAEAGNGDAEGGTLVDRQLYPDADAAKAAAQSQLAALNRGTASGRLQMPGRADIGADKILRLKDFKAGLDGDYLVESVTHTYGPQGWVMDVEINGGNEGKAKVGKAPSQKPSTRLVTLEKQ